MAESLTVVALVCTLKSSPAKSSSVLIARQLLDEFAAHGVTGELIRIADHEVRPGVRIDEGDGDEWPQIREKVRSADILVLSTPVWLGHMSSLAQRVLERLDAELSQTDDQGRPSMLGKVAAVAVVGNEDGAHKVIADVFQGLNDIGFTIPAQGSTYWNGEAMQTVDYQDLDETPGPTKTAGQALVRNSVHLARWLQGAQYPEYA
ncbi:flavodoxin family protein [Nocardia sp. BMG111209]|uniref:flavodoxin family protein n=1 Tax=Nocardia sp. BMG111209 TaxID=1160137 RepID=UPI0009DC29BA|nr:NAD(P)H-dependent oxidoreductase [Nocardia sp. BMG111209]